MRRAVAVVGVLGALVQAPLFASGPYGGDLSKCLVESTSTADRVDLVRWMFSAASAHPSVQPISAVSPEALEAANRKMGELIMRLLTEACRDAAVKAVRYEGATTIQAGFQLLGQVAAQELFASPEVAQAMAGMEKYLDSDKLAALGRAEEPPAEP